MYIFANSHAYSLLSSHNHSFTEFQVVNFLCRTSNRYVMDATHIKRFLAKKGLRFPPNYVPNEQMI